MKKDAKNTIYITGNNGGDVVEIKDLGHGMSSIFISKSCVPLIQGCYKNEMLPELIFNVLIESNIDKARTTIASCEISDIEKECIAHDEWLEKEETEQLRKEVRMYIMSDTHRKENFADTEICCEEDNYEANEKILEILEDYTREDCIGFINAVINGDGDILAGGWVLNGKYGPVHD